MLCAVMPVVGCRDQYRFVLAALTVAGQAAQVEAWGACLPYECSWGAAQADESRWDRDGILVVTWNPGFAVETQTISFASPSLLRVTTTAHFLDGSGLVVAGKVFPFILFT